MKNHEEKDCYKKEKAEKEYAKNLTEYVINVEPFIFLTSNQNHDSEKFIADSGAKSQMVNLEENMTKLKDSKTRVTVRYSRNITGGERGNWRGCQIRDIKIHHVLLSNIYVIPGLNENLFSVIQALQKGFQLTSEVETLILKKKSTKIHFDEKMANSGGEGILLTTNLYVSVCTHDLLDPKKRNPEGKAAVQPEGTAENNEEKRQPDNW